MAITQEIKDKISEYEKHYSSSEVLDSLAGSGKYPDVAAKIAEYRRHYGDDDVLESLKSAPINRGFLARVGEDLKNRAQNVSKAYQPTQSEINAPLNESIGETLLRAPTRALRLFGQAGGLIGDVAGEALTSLTPDAVKETLAEAGAHVMSRPENRRFAQGVSQAIGEVTDKYPTAVNAVEDAANLLALKGGSKLLPKGGPAKIKMPARIDKLNAVKNTATRNLSEKWNIPTTLGEDLGNVTLQKSETLLEKVPVLGIRKFREKQVLAADDAAKGFLGHYIANPKSPDFWGNKEFVDDLYKAVESDAASIRVKTSALDTLKSAAEVLDRYPTIFESIQDQSTKKILKNIADDAAEQTFSFGDLWMLRKGIGVAKETARGGGNLEAVGVLGKIKTAVDKDIDAISKISGSKVSEKLRAANDAYKHYNVKYEMVQQAYDKAVGKVGGGEMFSPKKFSTELKNMIYKNVEIKKNRLFKPGEIEEMTGLANIMQTVKRAGQFAENPPTGNRMADLVLGGGFGYGIAANPGAAATTAAVAGTMTFLTTTKAGKNLIRAAAKMKPNSAVLTSVARKAALGGAALGPVAATATVGKTRDNNEQ